MRWALVLLLVGVPPLVTTAVPPDAATHGDGPLDVAAGERLVIIAPHPDDETLAAGGLIQHVLQLGGSVRVILITAGDGYVEAVVHETGELRPRSAEYIAYGARRVAEARAALRALGGDRVRLQLIGFPDGGLVTMLRAHWQRTHPERSGTTGASEPPYPEVVDPKAAYDGADLRRELVNLLREARPTVVALPDPLDRHPDHHAAGLFTLLALADCTSADSTEGPTAAALTTPRLLAYLVHWPAWPPGWDKLAPQPDASAGVLELPANLPARGLQRTHLALTDTERRTKSEALASYASQLKETGPFLLAFVRHTEPFSVLTTAQVRRAEHMIERSGPRRPIAPPR